MRVGERGGEEDPSMGVSRKGRDGDRGRGRKERALWWLHASVQSEENLLILSI